MGLQRSEGDKRSEILLGELRMCAVYSGYGRGKANKSDERCEYFKTNNMIDVNTVGTHQVKKQNNQTTRCVNVILIR